MDKEFVFFKDGEMIINFMYEPPPPPEFRLYYDENGDIICYTGEKLEGNNYIVIDNQTFAESRHDVKVVDGKIVYKSDLQQVRKLKPSHKGTCTYADDISLIVDELDNIETQVWDFTTTQINHK